MTKNPLEVVYINIVEDWLKGPRLMTPKGRIIWSGKFLFLISPDNKNSSIILHRASTGLVFAYWSLGK